uniref:Lipase n=1 Tax=Streptomyces olivaceus TaxID=47716 RepID=A8KR20_STROV|nr:lipase [Streptomyces olivaceus]
MTGDRLSAAARGIVDMLSAGFPAALGPDTDVAALRQSILQQPSGLPELASVTDRTVPGPEGAPDVPVRIYQPGARGAALPVVVFFHGGGFVLCGLDSHDGLCRELAASSGAVVVSVDYRLAPEHPAPAAVEDAYAALAWVAAHAEELGADPARLAVAGDSAGGNLAAAVCLLARERGGPVPAAQVLIYPALDPAQDSASMREFGEGHFLTADQMRWYWEQYLAGSEPTPLTAPATAHDLSGLPPALLVEAECDPLRDEGRAYAARLPEADVHSAPGVFHGFLDFTAELPQAVAAQRRVAEWLRERLGAS